MTLKQYLLMIGFGTALSWAAAALIIFGIDPTETQAVVFAALYFSLLLGLTGLLSIIGFLLRVWLLPKELLSRQVLVSFRQAVLLSLLAVIGLILQSRSLLTWFNASLVVIGMTLIEFLFISARNKR